MLPYFGCFEGRGTSQPYRACPYAVAGTTHFLMVPKIGELTLTNDPRSSRGSQATSEPLMISTVQFPGLERRPTQAAGPGHRRNAISKGRKLS